MTLFRNKYRVKSIRLPGWDYASAGYYFVTICTKNREWHFGKVLHGEMHLSEIGEIAHQNWLDVPNHFPHVHPDAFVIMPDHMHGIVAIGGDATCRGGDATCRVATNNQFGPLKPGSLQTIVHAYKASVTRWCRKHGHTDFAWQSRFYEHIVRNEEALNRIRAYIANNPHHWR